MTILVIMGLAWLAVATALALVLGGAIRLADAAAERTGPDLRREVDDVMAGLEADLRAAATSPEPTA